MDDFRFCTQCGCSSGPESWQDTYCPCCHTFDDGHGEYAGLNPDLAELDPDDVDNAELMTDETFLRQTVQNLIHQGDFFRADTLCNEVGFDKLEFDWHS